MRTIVLTRLEGYTHRATGTEFTQNVPASVEDSLAESLLETGYFMDVYYAPEFDEIPGIFSLNKDSLPHDYVISPKNKIENDDLNGKRLMIRRNGGIGDIVFVSIFAQYIKNKFPKVTIIGGFNDGVLSFASCFSAFDKIMSTTEALRDDVLHSCHYIIEFNGVLGSESTTSEDDKDYFEAHFERAGMPCPEDLPMPDIGNLISNMSVSSAASEVIERSGATKDGYAVLLLGTSNPLKRLTVEQLRDLSKKYVESADGGPAKRLICLGSTGDRYFDSPDFRVRIENELSLPVSAEIVRRSTVVIGADTGLMQFAGALRIPTVSLWGPTDPRLSMDHYEGPKVVLTQEGKLECAPCRRIRTAFCPYYNSGYTDCMKKFDPMEIAFHAMELARNNPTHPTKELTADEVRKERKEKSTDYKVAVLLDNGDHYTGGGYYTWSLAKILASKPKVEVTVFTDAVVPDGFVYAKGDVIQGNSKLSVVRYNGDLKEWNDNEFFDLVIATPPNMGTPAVAYAKSRGAKTALLVYETPNYIAEHREGLDGGEDYWKDYKTALEEADAIWVISKLVSNSLEKWIPDVASKTYIIRPTVNSPVADSIYSAKSITERDREMVITIIGRNVKYKALAETVRSIGHNVGKNLNARLTVHVIGHKVSSLHPITDDVRRYCDVVLHENLSDSEKWALLLKSRVLLHPSEFEGFGIPIAEGLYAGAAVVCRPLPVVKDEFGDYPIYYSTDDELFSCVKTALEKWDGEGEELEATKRRQFAARKFGRNSQNPIIARSLSTHLRFSEVVNLSAEDHTKMGEALRVAVVSPWNTQCGIADTTKEALKNVTATYRVFSYTDIPTIYPDEDYVVRCWERTFSNPRILMNQIMDFGADVVHIHHEHSLFQHEPNFFAFLEELRRKGIHTIVTLHTYQPSGFTDKLFNTVDIVTTTKAQEGMSSTFVDVPLPIVHINAPNKQESRKKFGIRNDEFLVGTFGMWQEHKGFKEFMDSYDTLRGIMGDNVKYLISGAAPPKSQYLMECRRQHFDKIKGGLFLFFEDYPDISDVIERLSACDVLVFNYSVAHWSSASAAIRTAMMANVPIVCSASTMFSEFEDGKHVIKVPFGDSNALANAINMLKQDPALGEKLVKNCNAYCDSCSPERVALKWDRVYKSAVFGAEEED